MHYITWLPTALYEYLTLIFYAFPIGTACALGAEVYLRHIGRAIPGLVLTLVMIFGLTAVGDMAYWSILSQGFWPSLAFFLYGIGYCLLVTVLGFVLLLLINVVLRD